MISKKLLSEVLGYVPFKVSEMERPSSVGIKLLIIENEDGTVRAYWNIHELAHKCKEWALQYKYEFLSGYLSGRGYVVVMEQRRTWYADTEVEAIFKACEWLLKAKQ